MYLRITGIFDNKSEHLIWFVQESMFVYENILFERIASVNYETLSQWRLCFTIKMLRLDKEIDEAIFKKFLLFKTTSSDYGKFAPNVHTMPNVYFPLKGEFSQVRLNFFGYFPSIQVNVVCIAITRSTHQCKSKASLVILSILLITYFFQKCCQYIIFIFMHELMSSVFYIFLKNMSSS